MKKWILLLALYTAGQQTAVFGQIADSISRQAWAALAQPGSSLRWLKIRDDVKLSPRNFFEKSRTALGLSPRDEFRLLRSNTDELGMTHHRFQQYHKGYPVEGATYVLHETDGRVATANGNLYNGTEMVEPPKVLRETDALDQVMKLAPTQQFLWLDKKAEDDLKTRNDDPNATFYPEGKLVWLQSDGLRLAWTFDLHTADGQSERVWLDAATGEALKRLPLDIHCDAGTGVTTWNGTVNISTDQSGMNFILLDDCQAPNIHVFNAQDSASTAFSTEYTDADNNWQGQTSAIQTFFGLRQSWQYFLNTFGRNSYNNAGANINGYNQAGFIGANGTRNWSNASWSPGAQILRFGDNGTDGTANDDWNTVDIVGHEFAHAVTSNEADLDYEGESGALNESFSDIFGEMVELFTEGANDWLVGADRGAIRDMSNPNNANDPDTYLGTNWVAIGATCDGTNDQCGVHTNSGVQNFWFFLLSQGGSGVNDNGDTYSVQGIGAASAAAIAYRNLTVYLTNTSGYADAKQGAIQAAIDLFGNCSNEVLQCARAWNAAGVYSTDGFDYDVEVDCPVLDLVHGLSLPYHVDVFNDIRADCDIVANGAPVIFEAGHAVILKPGFRSGDNFHAFIDPCAAPKSAFSLSGGSAEGRQSISGNSASAQTNLEVFPNPFTGSLKIRFEVEYAGPVSLNLFDAYGHRVYSWYERETLQPGEYTARWDQTGLPNGFYTLELRSGKRTRTQKVVKTGD